MVFEFEDAANMASIEVGEGRSLLVLLTFLAAEAVAPGAPEVVEVVEVVTADVLAYTGAFRSMTSTLGDKGLKVYGKN